MNISRRHMLSRLSGAATITCFAPQLTQLFAADAQRQFKVGACDWSINKRSEPEALSLAKEIGLDGVQICMGTLINDMHLRKPEIQEKYRKLSAETGVAVASMGVLELVFYSYKSDERTEQWVSDSIDVCKAMGCRVILLAFFEVSDLKGDKKGTDEVVRRLKLVAPKAEKAGVILGIESWLSAEELMEIIDRVGSPAVQVYYDVANSEKMGYDIHREIRLLGSRKLICEFHLKETDVLLGQGKIDFKKVRSSIDEIGYSGWVQIEAAIPPGMEILPSYKENQRFVRRVFDA